MHNAIHHLVLFLAGVVAWALCIAIGQCLFGTYGAVVYTVFCGAGLYFLWRLAVSWHAVSRRERSMFFVGFLASLGAVCYLSQVAYESGLDVSPQRVREAADLQAALRNEPRFASVIVRYEMPPNTKYEGLVLRGSVDSDKDLVELHALLDDEGIWGDVKWAVTVLRSERPKRQSE